VLSAHSLSSLSPEWQVRTGRYYYRPERHHIRLKQRRVVACSARLLRLEWSVGLNQWQKSLVQGQRTWKSALPRRYESMPDGRLALPLEPELEPEEQPVGQRRRRRPDWQRLVPERWQ
jgi:hypothetical protein